MSFALSSKGLETIFRCSKAISSEDADPREPTQLIFPGGWDSKDSNVFKWYEVQPHKMFRKIQYYKERQGVGHEFVVLPLHDADGGPTEWFCRLERVANPTRQLAAIGPDGTEAFDYIQSFDDDLLGALRGAGLVAEIILPRDFDLYDVLAICSAITEHPQAHRYTLQQYNCYFFSWAIILSLARRAVDWENIDLRHMDDIRESILQSISTPTPEGGKVAQTLSTVHSSNTSPTQSLLYNVLSSELSSPEFFRSAHLAVSSTLWGARGHRQLKAALECRSDLLAEQTLELLTGRQEDDNDTNPRRTNDTETEPQPENDPQVLAWEGLLLFKEIVEDQITPQVEEGIQRFGKRYKDTTRHFTSRRAAGYLAGACLVLLFGLPHALWVAKLHDRIAKHRNKAKGIRTLKYIGNIARHLPRSLAFLSKWLPTYLSMVFLKIDEENDVVEFIDEYCSRALDLTIAELFKRHPEQESSLIGTVVLRLTALLKVNNDLIHDLSSKKIWSRLLWDFLGEIIVGAILRSILSEQRNEIVFICLQPSKTKKTAETESAFQSIPITQLQQFIAERIERLSRHDVEHAPIIQHIPLPAMAPSHKSCEQMEGALQEIWRTARMGQRFTGRYDRVDYRQLRRNKPGGDPGWKGSGALNKWGTVGRQGA
ncbi:hypothetical protein BDV93DRAFT_612349 [Ceratobasidium sp. AG-I]|nr:hypothetical protein BDV93DRAFT_612349 [Ceratobasidium sp. AG-I]